jgi:hypothetical protein
MLVIAEPVDDRQLVDENRVEVARLRVVEKARLLERVDNGDLEAKLFDRLDDTRVVVKRVRKDNAPAQVRDERLLPDLVEVPLADPALDSEVELRAAAELRCDPELATHELHESLRDG